MRTRSRFRSQQLVIGRPIQATLPDDTWILRPQDLPNGFQAEETHGTSARVRHFKERTGFHGCQMLNVLRRIIEVRQSRRAGSIPLGVGEQLIVAQKLGALSGLNSPRTTPSGFANGRCIIGNRSTAWTIRNERAQHGERAASIPKRSPGGQRKRIRGGAISRRKAHLAHDVSKRYRRKRRSKNSHLHK